MFSNAYNYHLRSFLTAGREENFVALAACRKEAKASCPFPLTSPYPLESTILAKSLAESRNYKHSCIIHGHSSLYWWGLHWYAKKLNWSSTVESKFETNNFWLYW